MHDDDADHAWFIFNLHTNILSVYLQITCNQLFGPDLFFLQEKKKFPLTWKADVLLMVANPIHFGPLPRNNCPPFTF
jgi:hypothetical protein